MSLDKNDLRFNTDFRKYKDVLSSLVEKNHLLENDT